MKVGILTYHSSYNFGANLQALSIQSSLQQRGVDPIIINYRDPRKTEKFHNLVSPEQAAVHEEFFNQRYILSPTLEAEKEVEEYCREELDAVLVGSDAVFRLKPKYQPRNILEGIIKRKGNSLDDITDHLPPYWLQWKGDGGRKAPVAASVAASSMGTNFMFLQPRLRRDICSSLSGFEYVSVRDDWTRSIISRVTHKKVVPEICPDPVFSLATNFNDWSNCAPPCDLSRTILLSGAFKSDWVREFTLRAHDAGFTVSNLPNPDQSFTSLDVDFHLNLPMTPLQWVRIIAESAGVVGIRFHALVCAIADGTPMVSVEQPRRFSLNIYKRSKVFDLCQRAGMSKNFYLMRDIVATPPSTILKRLFDTSTREAARRYARWADKTFGNTIDKVLTITKERQRWAESA